MTEMPEMPHNPFLRVSRLWFIVFAVFGCALTVFVIMSPRAADPGVDVLLFLLGAMTGGSATAAYMVNTTLALSRSAHEMYDLFRELRNTGHER